jgi:hypothetical protein
MKSSQQSDANKTNPVRKGRRPKPPGEKATCQVPIHLTEADHDLVTRAAKRAGDSTSRWCGKILVRAAQVALNSPIE